MAVRRGLLLGQQDSHSTYDQIVSSLLHLEDASTSVFDELTRRIVEAANLAEHLRARLQAAEAKLKHLAESGATATFVTPSHHPTISSRYVTTFSEVAEPCFRLARSPSGTSASSDAEGHDELAAQQSQARQLSRDVENASQATSMGQLREARKQLQAAVDGLQQLQQAGGSRVVGCDAAELLHFLNQPSATEESAQQGARDLPADLKSAAQLLPFGSDVSPYVSRMEVPMPQSSGATPPAFDIQSIASTLPEVVPRELRSQGSSVASPGSCRSPAGKGRETEECAAQTRHAPEIRLPSELPHRAHLGTTSNLSGRTYSMRSSRLSSGHVALPTLPPRRHTATIPFTQQPASPAEPRDNSRARTRDDARDEPRGAARSAAVFPTQMSPALSHGIEGRRSEAETDDLPNPAPAVRVPPLALDALGRRTSPAPAEPPASASAATLPQHPEGSLAVDVVPRQPAGHLQKAASAVATSSSGSAIDLQRSVLHRHLSLGGRRDSGSLHDGSAFASWQSQQGVHGRAPQGQHSKAGDDTLSLRAYIRQRETQQRPSSSEHEKASRA